jgi:hypothetical protein
VTSSMRVLLVGGGGRQSHTQLGKPSPSRSRPVKAAAEVRQAAPGADVDTIACVCEDWGGGGGSMVSTGFEKGLSERVMVSDLSTFYVQYECALLPMLWCQWECVGVGGWVGGLCL